MSRQPEAAVLSDSEEVTVVEDVVELVPFNHWTDARAYNKVLKACQPCFAKGRTVALQNKGKALNHWAGHKGDTTATIHPCLCVDSVPGLQKWAREQIETKIHAKVAKASLEVAQRMKDSARGSTAPDSQSEGTVSGEGGQRGVKRPRNNDLGFVLPRVTCRSHPRSHTRCRHRRTHLVYEQVGDDA